MSSVVVQANSGAAEPMDETAWSSAHALEFDRSVAIVGPADVASENPERSIERQLPIPGFRGVRVFAGWDDNPLWRQTPDRHFLRSDAMLQTAEALTNVGSSLDIVVFPRQLSDVARLARDFPDLKIAINHLAMLRPGHGDDCGRWSDGIAETAAQRNVFIKISGLWTIDRAWSADVIGPFVNEAVRCFGADRCMYGSNMPVEGVMIGVPDQITRLSAALADLTVPEKDAVFRRTATEFYRLD